MIKTMKTKIIVVLALLGGSLSLFSQTRYSFSYDASGNRVDRKIVFKSGNEALTEEEQFLLDSGELSEEYLEEEAEKESIGAQQITIAPNPTRGKMAVKVDNMEAGATGSLAVYDVQGKAILSQPLTGDYTQVDLSAQPAGNYILTIQLGNQKREWQIVKQ